MRQEKMQQFADTVKNWNRKDELAVTPAFLLLLFFVNLFINCISRDYGELFESGWKGLLIWGFCGILTLIIYTAMYLNEYLSVKGENGKLSRELIDVVCRMPFSLEDYFAVIKQRFRKVVNWIGTVTFIIFMIGLAISEMSKNSSGLYSIAELMKMLLVCVLGTGIVLGTMAGSFWWIERITFHKWIKRTNGIPGKEKSQGKWRSRVRYFVEKLNLIGYMEILFCILFLIVMEIIFDVRMPLDEMREMHYNYGNNIIVFGLVLIFVPEIIQQWKHIINGEKAKKILLAMNVIGLLIVVVYFQGTYEVYYENRLESYYYFSKTEYTLEDVKSYTVKKKSFSQDIQLELEMEDDMTFSVISSNSLYSDYHWMLYGTNFEYVAAYVKRLDALGIPGTLEDEGKLRKIAGRQEKPEQAEKALEELGY